MTGKYCPGVVGWNAPSGDKSAWEEFKRRISAKEDDDMITQVQFNQMMNTYLSELAQKDDAAWGTEWEAAKQWAESNGIILGDENGNKQYRAWSTRQAMVLMLYRLSKK